MICSPFHFKNLFDILRIIYKDMDLYISWDVLEVQCIDLKFLFLLIKKSFFFSFFFAFEIIKGFSTNTIDLVSLKLSVVPLLKIISIKYKL